MIRFLLYTMLACVQPANAHIEIFNKIDLNLNLDLRPEFDDSYTAELDPYAKKGLKDSYLSSVVIDTGKDGAPAGMGSGNYFKLGKHRFILTAAHVVNGVNQVWIIEKGMVTTPAEIVYISADSDLAILRPVRKLRYTKALPFRRDINNQMGEKIYHTGHPAMEGWHMSEGILTGTHEDVLMLNSFAWPGSSGSVVFDEHGRVLGVVSALRMDAIMGIFPQYIEHIILATNIKTLDQETLKAALRNGE
tara:strand:+ start:1309 stop:2052 length:744 start_codon:yes stop_codon:yes gene_type:complete